MRGSRVARGRGASRTGALSLCVGLALCAPVQSARAGPPPPSSGAMASLPGSQGAPDAERERIWVFFDEAKTSQASAWAELVARAREARRLGPRTLARRAKVAGTTLVRADDLPIPRAWIQAVLATGARVRVHSRWLRAVSVEVDADGRRALEALEFVDHTQRVRTGRSRNASSASLISNPKLRPRDAQAHAEQLHLLGADYWHACGFDGTGILVGVQDTGFDLTHPALANVNVVAEYDFVDDDEVVAPETDDAPGQQAHGTMVLSLLAGLEADTGASPNEGPLYRGVAPGVSVVLTKTEDVSQEDPFEEDLYVAGLEFVEAQGADLFTASLGYVDWYSPEDLDGQTAVTTQAVNAALERGLIVLNAVGNGGGPETSLVAPADAMGLLSIGSVDPRGALSSFSSWGPTADGRIKPEFLAPGEDVYVADWEAHEGYFAGNGTSFATPMAAGLVALLLQNDPSLDPMSVRAQLIAAADPQANPGASPANGYGHGRMDGQRLAPEMCACMDLDGDGVDGLACGGSDCDDNDASVQPGADELCNRRDDDCDGELLPDELDLDKDGWAVCEGDCDDEDPSRHPAVAERCDNEVDDNCDGLTDALDPMCEEAETSGESEDGEVGTGEASDTSDGPGVEESATGCACSEARGRGGPLGLLGVLGLLGLLGRPGGRRRRRLG